MVGKKHSSYSERQFYFSACSERPFYFVQHIYLYHNHLSYTDTQVQNQLNIRVYMGISQHTISFYAFHIQVRKKVRIRGSFISLEIPLVFVLRKPSERKPAWYGWCECLGGVIKWEWTIRSEIWDGTIKWQWTISSKFCDGEPEREAVFFLP